MNTVEPPRSQVIAEGATRRGEQAGGTASVWTETLSTLADRSLDPLFWRAERLGSPSAWWQHVPFAHWVVAATAPRLLVELGTHAGVSYAAFCQAVVRAGLGTRCYAVDTWRGDPHAGCYGDEVLQELRRFHDPRFGAFSMLLQCTFDEALERIEGGSVDLLHIDGLHTYEAVRHDFESWLPRLSDQAVVLFHDINEHGRDFGVWRLWDELRQRNPTFELLHGHGLGLLAVGEHVPAPIAALCQLREPALARVRWRFAQLGQHWLADTQRRMLLGEVERGVAAASAEATRRGEEIASVRAAADRAAEDLRSANARARRAAEEVAGLEARATQAEGERARAKAAARTIAAQMAELESAFTQVRVEHEGVLASTSWRLTRPLRALSHRLPRGVRRAVRGSAKVCWWTLTMRLPDELRERHNALRATAVSGRAEPTSDATAPVASMPEPPPPPLQATAANSSLERRIRPKSGGTLSFVYISGEPHTPGHLYRIMRPIGALTPLGVRTSWMPVEDVHARMEEIEAADALVIWRAPWDRHVAAAVRAARRGGAKIVFDVDDLMIMPELATLDVIDGIRTQNLTENAVQDYYARIRDTLSAADLCVASTEELAQRMREALKPAFVLPNGVDRATIVASSLAVRRRAAEASDGLFRIGYAGGSRTHQRDFALCADAVASALRARPNCRLVVFRSLDRTTPVLDIGEFPALRDLGEQIEWRDFVPLENLPYEMARFDVNLAPLEVGNPFCEAKSELKLFEAALAGVPTIASPTGPFRRAVRHGYTGFLAATPGNWRDMLASLIDDAALRRRVAGAARREALWLFGPERRIETMASLLDLLQGGRRAARAFQARVRLGELDLKEPRIPEHDVLFGSDHFGTADITVVVPLYNYAGHVEEALNSVRAQTLAPLDLVVVEDRSTDDSLGVALRWARANAGRFNRLLVLRNRANSGLAHTRNTGFDAAETPFVLPLDADNRLLPECAAECLRTLQDTGAAFAYPAIRKFGASNEIMGTLSYDPQRLAPGNYIDAMALISKAAWIAAGGYKHVHGGWEDFAFWCQLAELGFWGEQVPGAPLAEYRVHPGSMIQVATAQPKAVRRMMDEVGAAHPWLRLVWPSPVPEPSPLVGEQPSRSKSAAARLERMLPLLRCPETGQRLSLAPGADALLSEDGSRRWPLVRGRPLLFPGMNKPAVNEDAHLSNPLPASALGLIHGTAGPILHLSAGGSVERFEHVIETEAAVFRHTDLIADVHHLPFADQAFDAVIALNAFEHYRDPHRAAREILRVLRPGGRVLIHTAFMQPLHERPWHFYNCTRFGLEGWFEGFEIERLHVSDNFHPGHSLSWLASECESALRRYLSGPDADAFLAAPLRRFVRFWRMPESRRDGEPLWDNLAALPQDAQEVTAAGFEFLGRRPESGEPRDGHASGSGLIGTELI